MVDVTPDPKPTKRVKDKKVLKKLHLKGVRCVLCNNAGSLHHIYPTGQGGDDVESNLLGLCGDGVSGHHGAIEANDVVTRICVGDYLISERPDFMFYLQGKLGEERGREWLRRKYFMSI